MKKTYKAFSAGELAPEMYGRYDIDKYGTGCMILKNWIIMTQGGAYKRPGQKFRAQGGKEATAIRLIPFEFSTIQAYVLEFGEYYMRVYKDGNLVLETAQNITGATQANPAEITIAAHGFATGNEVFISGVGGMTQLNNRQFKITVTGANTFTLDGVNSSAYTAFTAGGTAARVYEIVTPYPAADLGTLYYAQTADVMTLCHKNWAPRELTRTGHTAWTITPTTFQPSVTEPANMASAIGVGAGAVVYKYRVTAVIEDNYEESLPGYEATRAITGATQANPCQITAVAHGYTTGDTVKIEAVGGMTQLNGNTYTITNTGANTFTLNGINSTAFTAYTAGGTSKRTHTQIANNLAVAGNTNIISWSAVTNAIKYNIYKDKSGVYGYIGSSEALAFTDTNIDPDVTDTPPRAGNPFGADGSGMCPSVVSFQQQRRIFANTIQKPDTIWMSRAGAYNNMTTSLPNKNDDAITFAIASGQVNAIRHLIPFRQLLAMTTSQEWKIGSEGVLAPTTVDAVPETSYGSAEVKPLVIGNTAIFAARYGKRIRDYAYTFESDGYDGNDLSVLSRHLLKNKQIKEWAFAQEPDDVIWAVMSDGTLCTLTYMREHRVWGWARHETDGIVESVAVIPSEADRRDIVYFVVKRTIGGVDRRYIETLEEYIDDPMEDAFFLDCALTRTGVSATDTVGGLWHLEGKTVKVYADGNVLADEVVSSGTITLSQEYNTITVGLGYDYELQPMASETDQGAEGATKGDPKQIRLLYLEVLRTRGLFAAQNKGEQLNEIKPQFANGDMAQEILPHTGILEVGVGAVWSGGYVAPYIYDNYPVPAKILTMTPVYG